MSLIQEQRRSRALKIIIVFNTGAKEAARFPLPIGARAGPPPPSCYKGEKLASGKPKKTIFERCENENYRT